jgi:replicative DNA helicase
MSANAPAGEREVLGSMLRDPRVIGDVLQILREDDFYTDAHRKVFVALVCLYDQHKPVELPTVADELHRRGQVEDIGGYPYIAQLLDAAPTAVNARYYAQMVRDSALRRSLEHAGATILRNAHDGVASPGELLEEAESLIAGIAQMGSLGNTVRLADSITAVYDRYDARAHREGINGLPTGFIDLDEKLAGLHDGELIVIAARPSVGKTQFALTIAIHNAHGHGHPVFFATLEQTHQELTERLLVREGRVDGHAFRRGTMQDKDIAAFIAAGDRLKAAPLFYEDSAGQTMLRVAANARRLKLKEGIRLVLVDYLQLIESEKSKQNRQDEVASISRRLKHLARELKVPIIALSQLNRDLEKSGREPKLSDLRDSGAVEQDADVVLLLHRPDDAKDIIKVNCAKQRNGPIGEIELTFDRRFGRFDNYVPDPFARGLQNDLP